MDYFLLSAQARDRDPIAAEIFHLYRQRGLQVSQYRVGGVQAERPGDSQTCRSRIASQNAGAIARKVGEQIPKASVENDDLAIEIGRASCRERVF